MEAGLCVGPGCGSHAACNHSGGTLLDGQHTPEGGREGGGGGSLAKASERALSTASLIMHESSPRRQGLGKGLEQR